MHPSTAGSPWLEADQGAMEIWEQPICNRGASVGGPGVKDGSEFQSYTVVGMWVHRVSSQASSIFRVTG